MIDRISLVIVKDLPKDVLSEISDMQYLHFMKINDLDVTNLRYFMMPQAKYIQQLMNKQIDEAYFQAITSKPPKFCMWAFGNGVSPQEKIILDFKGVKNDLL